MELITYKTNISSESAFNRVKPYLDNAVGRGNWQLDLCISDKKLTVYSPDVINESVVIGAIHKAGFRAVNIEDYYSIY